LPFAEFGYAVHKTRVGIFIFDDVDPLDFVGPFEVFCRTRLIPGVQSRRSEQSAPFQVYTVAEKSAPVITAGGLQVVPHFDFWRAPRADLLVIPGGLGTRALLDRGDVINWIRQRAGEAENVASVCTGALLLARAGLLQGRRATTHWGALDLLASLDDTLVIERTERVVHDGVITSAGVSAGIDMALAVVELLHGRAVADETAQYIEFSRTQYSLGPESNPSVR
jgi:transcriptional regulator GlxA family with amidase domain